MTNLLSDDDVRKFRALLKTAWKDHQITIPTIEDWVQNFTGVHLDEHQEKDLMIKLLQGFLYIGVEERKELSRCLINDLCRDLLAETTYTEPKSADVLLKQKLQRTRFAAVGGPSESSGPIMYELRTHNALPKMMFPTEGELKTQLKNGIIDNIVFVDDFCCTGEQVKSEMSKFIADLRGMSASVKITYRLLCASKQAIERLTNLGMFHSVNASMIFDDDYQVFSNESIFFKDRNKELPASKEIAKKYGRSLWCDEHSMGYKNSQMMLGFIHNVPDNTLPIFWANNRPDRWKPIFPRAHKF